MGRIGSQYPEVVHGLDQPLFQMPTPDSIHDHSGKKRISTGCNPFGKLQPSAFVFPGHIIFSHGEKIQESACLKIAFQVRIATQKNMQFRYVALFDAQ